MISDAYKTVVSSFLKQICTSKNLDKSEVLKIWNECCPEMKIKDLKDSEENKNRCQKLLASGKNQGQQCSRNINKDSNQFCTIHMKGSKKKKKNESDSDDDKKKKKKKKNLDDADNDKKKKKNDSDDDLDNDKKKSKKDSDEDSNKKKKNLDSDEDVPEKKRSMVDKLQDLGEPKNKENKIV